jgi:hypothetical protein
MAIISNTSSTPSTPSTPDTLTNVKKLIKQKYIIKNLQSNLNKTKQELALLKLNFTIKKSKDTSTIIYYETLITIMITLIMVAVAMCALSITPFR